MPIGIAFLLVIYSVVPRDSCWFAYVNAQFPFCLSFELMYKHQFFNKRAWQDIVVLGTVPGSTGNQACLAQALLLTRINLLARFEVKKKFSSRSESRTVLGVLFVFLFCIGPAALLGSSGHFHPTSSFLLLMSVVFFMEPFLVQVWVLGTNLQFSIGSVVSVGSRGDAVAVLGRCG